MGRSPEIFNSGYDEYFKIIYSDYYEYFKNINSGYYKWLSGAREYVSSYESALLCEWCMRVVHEGVHDSTWVVHESGARDYGVVHEWYTRQVHESM